MKNGVQGKIQCIFKCVAEELPSKKRVGQNYRIVATKEISKTALSSNLETAIATEKLDGTCCYVKEYQGKLALWARLDRKPNKKSDKRFKKFQQEKRNWNANGKEGTEPRFIWKYPDDMKEVPASWMPAHNVDIDKSNGYPIPDENGHIPGWVPISHDKRQYCWHHSVVIDSNQLALVLQSIDGASESGESCSNGLEIKVKHLSELDGMTLELIGTNINGNPYGLGSKTCPMHLLSVHGDIKAEHVPMPLEHEHIFEWFQNKHKRGSCGNVEGIVWHCKDNTMYKVHRHHLGLIWPLHQSGEALSETEIPNLCTRHVHFNSCLLQNINSDILQANSQFHIVKNMHMRHFESLRSLKWNIAES
uniref:RNA ligase 1 n=1 Tax=Phallusia mammillata TaxID=59560 RepID=A0A6F9D7C4_9ASCI|nr:uncharacterized protein C12orf29 homolog [Phallusia mammillata]